MAPSTYLAPLLHELCLSLIFPTYNSYNSGIRPLLMVDGEPCGPQLATLILFEAMTSSVGRRVKNDNAHESAPNHTLNTINTTGPIIFGMVNIDDGRMAVSMSFDLAENFRQAVPTILPISFRVFS